MAVEVNISEDSLRRSRRSTRRNLLKGLFFVSPWIVGFSVFVIYPIVMSFYYSFTEYTVLRPPEWIGLFNYEDLLYDEVFWTSLYNTAYYAAIALPLGLLLALSLALLLNTKVKGLTFFRTIFFFPYLVPTVVLAVLFLWIYNGRFGLLNYLLSLVGINGPAWLEDPAWTKPALIIMSLYVVGQAMIIYLAGLQDVPRQLYEAADLDGANWWHKIWHVTLPMISPVILFNLILGIIGVFQIFALPFIMTDGGPGRSSTFYVLWLYKQAFKFFHMGYASAMAWMLFGIILILTLVALRVSSRRVYYESG